jgi:hypothetical protein
MVTKKTVYIAYDGTEHETYQKAVSHNNMKNGETQEYFDKYIATYRGQNLLSKHSLEDEGFWEVRGEDPNCDLGGKHYEPIIGVFEGKLRDVIKTAVMTQGFWQWGSGGSIKSYTPIVPKKV